MSTNLELVVTMDYRKFSNTVKGMYIRWGGDIFPDYRDVSGPHVSHKRLQRAKSVVVLILAQVIVSTLLEHRSNIVICRRREESGEHLWSLVRNVTMDRTGWSPWTFRQQYRG